VISKDVLAEGSYCHIKFPAIEERTLSWNRPVLKDPSPHYSWFLEIV
jgi:hypothetical protein